MEKEIGKEFDVHDYMSETTVDILLGKPKSSVKHLVKLIKFKYSNLICNWSLGALVIDDRIFSETAMGHKRIGDDDDGYKYAMAVMKYVI